MPTISTTTPPQKNTVKAVQLKALEERQKAQELAMMKAVQPQTVDSPWQGVANMANAFFTANRGARLQRQEDAARDQLASIRAGFGPEGPTMAQIQQVAQYDADAANKMQDDLLARNFQRAQQEDTQAHQTGERIATQGFTTSERIGGQEFTKQQNESDHDFELRKQEARNTFEAQQNDATRGVTTRGQDLNATQAAATVETQKRGQDIAAETANQNRISEEKQAQDAIQASKDAAIAQPDSADGKIWTDFRDGKFGDPTSPAAIKSRDDAIAAEHVKGTPPTVPAEVGARVKLGDVFLNQYPQLRAEIAGGGATGLWDALKGGAWGGPGWGDQGKIHRAISAGSDALVRQLTGQGMAVAEAEKYRNRYQATIFDTSESLASKMDELKAALEATKEGSTMGRNWIDQNAPPVDNQSVNSTSTVPPIPSGVGVRRIN